MGRVPVLPPRQRAVRTDGDSILYEAHLRHLGGWRYEVRVTEQAIEPEPAAPGDPGPIGLTFEAPRVKWGLRAALRYAERRLDRAVLFELRRGGRVVSSRAVTPEMRGPA